MTDCPNLPNENAARQARGCAARLTACALGALSMLVLAACATAPQAAEPLVTPPPAVASVPAAPAAEPPAPPSAASVALPAAAEVPAGLPPEAAPRQRLDPDADAARASLWDRIRAGYAMPDLDGALVQRWERR